MFNKITKHYGLSKAFDVLDHQILLNKLYQYGFRGLSHAWLTSYFANRSQQVYIHGKLSAETLIDTGVPQGSNLGPLLFLIYVNDLFLNTTAELIMYADDMTLIVPGKSRADVVNIANEQLVRVFSWLTNNKLIMNTTKTKYMIFSPKNRNTKTTCEPDIQLKIANVAISEVDNFKFLGTVVSNNFSWKAHMLCVRNKLRACLALIYKSRDKLTRSCMLTLFFSFAYMQPLKLLYFYMVHYKLLPIRFLTTMLQQNFANYIFS